MALTPVPNQSQIQQALRAVLLQILPAGVEIIEGQDNDVAEPSGSFVMMTTMRRERLSTNVTRNADCKFVGSIAGTILTVQRVVFGAIVVGRTLFGEGVISGTTILSLGTGTGGAGTYVLSKAQTLDNTMLAAGATQIAQPTRVAIQLDVHAESMADASDMAETISTVLRDPYGVDLFKATGIAVTPLMADDPKQIPFLNAEQDYETRYVIDALLQVDQVLTPAQEFADEVIVPLTAADAAYAA